MMKKLWSDENGAVISTELVLVLTILGIGLITGLKTIQQSLVSEFVDNAQAISSMNQSYYMAGMQGRTSSTAGSFYVDAPNPNVGVGVANTDPVSRCVIIYP